AFPPFIDETIHIHSGEIILQNGTPFYDVVLGRQFTIWWLMLFQPAAAAPIWVARTATLLAVLPGFAALMSVARLAAGRWGMLFFGVIYLLSAYHLFFERLALADPIAGTAVTLAIWFAFRLTRRIRLRDSALAGFWLFVAFGAKTSAAPFFGVPVAAALALFPRGSRWRDSLKLRLRWLTVALGVAFGLSALFVVGLRLRGYDIITNSLSLAVSGRGTIDEATIFSLQRIVDNVGFTLETLAAYFGIGGLLVMLIGVMVLLARRQWFFVLCLLGPLAVIWLNTIQQTRYLLISVTLLLLCTGVALAQVTRKQPLLRWAALGVIVMWGMVYALPFMTRLPAALPLSASDFEQYVLSDASGFGFAEVYAVLHDRQPHQIIGALSNCQGLRYALPADFSVTCPLIRADAQDREALTALFDVSRADGVYVVLEDSPYVPQSAPGTLITVIDVGRPRLSIYDLAP
ncbi:MAG: hypothetical protein ABI835_09770, partial [Chloroflexota bacterium]